MQDRAFGNTLLWRRGAQRLRQKLNSIQQKIGNSCLQKWRITRKSRGFERVSGINFADTQRQSTHKRLIKCNKKQGVLKRQKNGFKSKIRHKKGSNKKGCNKEQQTDEQKFVLKKRKMHSKAQHLRAVQKRLLRLYDCHRKRLQQHCVENGSLQERQCQGQGEEYAGVENTCSQNLRWARGRRFSWHDFVDHQLQPRFGQTNIVEVGSGDASFAQGFRTEHLVRRSDVFYVPTSQQTFDDTNPTNDAAGIELHVDVEAEDSALEETIAHLKRLLSSREAASHAQQLDDDLETTHVHLLIFNNPLSTEFANAQVASRRGQKKTHTEGRQLADANRSLLDAYFKFAQRVVDPSEGWVHVMFSSTNHYFQWNVLKIARLHGFELATFGLFDNDVPGYQTVHTDGSFTGNYMVLPMVCMFKSKSKRNASMDNLGSSGGLRLEHLQWLQATEAIDKGLRLTPVAEELLNRCPLHGPLAHRVFHYWQRRWYAKALKLLWDERKAKPDAARAHNLICDDLCQQRARVRSHSLATVQGAISFNGTEGRLIRFDSTTGRFQVSIVTESAGTIVKLIKIQNLTFLSGTRSEASHPGPAVPADPQVLLLTFSRIPAVFHEALLEDTRLAECRRSLEAQALPIKLASGAKVFVHAEHYEPLMEVLRGLRFTFQTWHVFLEPSLEPVVRDIATDVNHRLKSGKRLYWKGVKVVPLCYASKVTEMGFKDCVVKSFIDIKLPSSLRSAGASDRRTQSTTDADPRKVRKRRKAQE